MNKFLVSILLFFLIACSIDRERGVDREKFLFKMGDDTELFFKNIRASYYLKEERDETRWDIYRNEDLYAQADSTDFKVAIIINVLQDEAYLMVEPGATLAEIGVFEILAIDNTESVTDTLFFDQYNKEEMLEFSTRLYEAVRGKRKLVTLYQNDTINVLKEDIREPFRVTMSDYYRLVRIF